jgi:hypothetical protein
MNLTHERPQIDASTRRWAVVRLLLAYLQITGAIVSAVLLLQTGTNTASLGAVVLTCALTTMSVILFGSHGKKQKHEEKER